MPKFHRVNGFLMSSHICHQLWIASQEFRKHMLVGKLNFKYDIEQFLCRDSHCLRYNSYGFFWVTTQLLLIYLQKYKLCHVYPGEVSYRMTSVMKYIVRLLCNKTLASRWLQITKSWESFLTSPRCLCQTWWCYHIIISWIDL